MVLYTCPRCSYKSTLRNDLRRHFNRKRPCTVTSQNISIDKCKSLILNEDKADVNKCQQNQGISLKNVNKDVNKCQQMSIFLENVNKCQQNIDYENIPQIANSTSEHYICEYCNKSFNSRQGKHQHVKKCLLKKKLYTLEEVEERLAEKLAAKLAEKDNIISELRTQISTLLDKVGTTYHTSNTYNIVINPFGQENTSYITQDYIKKLVNDGPYRSIPKLLKYIHFHPEHKENHNVKIPNKKQPYAQIYNGTGWEYQSKKDTINLMSDRAYYLLNKHYEGYNTYLTRFKDDYDENNPELNKRLSHEIEILIINHQLILKDNKDLIVNDIN